jgi:CubicO group peptidase (beta-lactamase class C family)
MTDSHRADDLHARVQAYLDRAVASGDELGLQVAVMRNGELVVDAVSGVADPRTGNGVDPDTLFFAASTAKGIATSVAHVLVERGELEYDLRAVDVWPEFAAHGKRDVTLRHVLLHTAGVPAPPYATTVEDLCDWHHMCAVLADAAPWWPAGTRFGYHAQTFGFLLGEIVRRATGRTLSSSLRELVAAPLGVVDDVHFGVPPELLGRIAAQVPPVAFTPRLPEPGSPADRAIPPGIRPDAAFANRRDVLTADIPSFGTMTARGAATVYAALLGQFGAVQLVAPERLADIASLKYRGMDEVMEIETTWAFGYSMQRPGGAPSRPGSTFGMVGMNGSAAYADIDSGVAVALMRNRFGGPDLTAISTVDHMIADNFRPTGH